MATFQEQLQKNLSTLKNYKTHFFDKNTKIVPIVFLKTTGVYLVVKEMKIGRYIFSDAVDT